MNYTELTVGYHGVGTVNITGGTHVGGTLNGVDIGELNETGSHGTVAVSGAGTMLSAHDFYVEEWRRATTR